MPVYARERKTTQAQYVATAQKLQAEIMIFCMNEKRFSKKYRFILVQDIINKSSEFADNVIGSNAVFPNTEEKLALRKRYLERAIINIAERLAAEKAAAEKAAAEAAAKAAAEKAAAEKAAAEAAAAAEAEAKSAEEASAE